jgi:hypothetical protein
VLPATVGFLGDLLEEGWLNEAMNWGAEMEGGMAVELGVT